MPILQYSACPGWVNQIIGDYVRALMMIDKSSLGHWTEARLVVEIVELDKTGNYLYVTVNQ